MSATGLRVLTRSCNINRRDQYNPTFRRLRLADIDFSSGQRKSMVSDLVADVNGAVVL